MLNSGDAISNGCAVCAVGAVLRRQAPQGLTGFQFESLCSRQMGHSPSSLSRCANEQIDQAIHKALINSEYLAALSLYFESNRMRKMNQGRRRAALIKFVEKHFHEDVHVVGL